MRSKQQITKPFIRNVDLARREAIEKDIRFIGAQLGWLLRFAASEYLLSALIFRLLANSGIYTAIQRSLMSTAFQKEIRETVALLEMKFSNLSLLEKSKLNKVIAWATQMTGKPASFLPTVFLKCLFIFARVDAISLYLRATPSAGRFLERECLRLPAHQRDFFTNEGVNCLDRLIVGFELYLTTSPSEFKRGLNLALDARKNYVAQRDSFQSISKKINHDSDYYVTLISAIISRLLFLTTFKKLTIEQALENKLIQLANNNIGLYELLFATTAFIVRAAIMLSLYAYFAMTLREFLLNENDNSIFSILNAVSSVIALKLSHTFGIVECASQAKRVWNLGLEFLKTLSQESRPLPLKTVKPPKPERNQEASTVAVKEDNKEDKNDFSSSRDFLSLSGSSSLDSSNTSCEVLSPKKPRRRDVASESIVAQLNKLPNRIVWEADSERFEFPPPEGATYEIVPIGESTTSKAIAEVSVGGHQQTIHHLNFGLFRLVADDFDDVATYQVHHRAFTQQQVQRCVKESGRLAGERAQFKTHPRASGGRLFATTSYETECNGSKVTLHEFDTYVPKAH